MKKVLNLALGLIIASVLFISCSDSDDENIFPELEINSGIVLQNGESKVITTAELSFSDVDSENIEVVYTVTEAPEHGKLVNTSYESVSISNFTQQDIVDEKIVYIHDGSLSLADSFTFDISNGDEANGGFTFAISIGEKQISFFYVLNEGSSNGSVSMINTKDEVTNNYFQSANSIPLGQYPQSMAVNDEYAFIVVTTGNSSGYVEVVNKSDFTHVATISGLSYPREIAITGEKAYISNGTGADGNYLKQNNEIYVVSLTNMTITSEIEVGAGPEKMVESNGKLYVANSGGWSNDDNTVSVIDIDTDEVIETITVKSCPKDMAVDADGGIWVYCSGAPDYSNYPDVTYTNSGISKINASSGAVTSFDLSNLTTTGIKNITISKDKKTVYYMSDAVYAMDITDTALPTVKFIDATFYGMDVNPVTGNLWMCEAVDATAAGKVHVYNPQAEKLKSFTVGNMPNSTTFSY